MQGNIIEKRPLERLFKHPVIKKVELTRFSGNKVENPEFAVGIVQKV